MGDAEETPPQPFDCAITFAVPWALEKLRPGGTLAINAISLTPIPEMKYDLIYGERTLHSVANATYQDGVEFIALAAEIGIQSTVNLYDLADPNQALEDMKHSRINGEAVVPIRHR